MIKKFIIIVLLFTSSLNLHSAFLNMTIGPDIVVKEAKNAYNSARFRMGIEMGSRNLSFLIQPSFGNDVSAVFVGVRLMYPIGIGDAPLFFIPDIGSGIDLGFDSDNMGLALDLKTGVRVFYEFYPGMAFSIRPVGLAVRFFNLWMGDRDSQTSASVSYELQVGFTYFF